MLSLRDFDIDIHKSVNNLICNSNKQEMTDEERLSIKLKAWDLIPKPATDFYHPSSSLACGISDIYLHLGDVENSLKWILLALQAMNSTSPSATIFLQAVEVYYALEDFENAYKYCEKAYEVGKYNVFAGIDKKYWQFFKQEKENRS